MSKFLQFLLILQTSFTISGNLLFAQADSLTGNTSPIDKESAGVQTLSLLFAGDIMQHDSQIHSAYNASTDSYEYDGVFEYVKDIISSYDLSVVNLECTFGGKPYKGYPQFSAPEELGAAMKRAGFNVILTANNHSCDRHKIGIVNTIDVLDSLSLEHLGTYRNRVEANENHPLILDTNGFRIAFLNYTYGTNGIPVPEPTVVNIIDTSMIKTDLKMARKAKVDLIIVLYHWGLEYKRFPNQKQKQLVGFSLKNGADYIIGSHPHVIQPMEFIDHPHKKNRKSIVVYSLGNYVSNQRKRFTDGGAMVGIHVSKEVRVDTSSKQLVFEEVVTDSVGYYLTWVYKEWAEGKNKFYIIPVSDYENKSIHVKGEKYKSAVELFIDDSRKHLSQHNVNFPEYGIENQFTSVKDREIVSPDDSNQKQGYYVQFFVTSGFFDKTLMPADWSDMLYIEIIEGKKKLKRYLLGGFNDPAEARKMMETVVSEGYEDAFIVYYKDDERQILKVSE